jgi:hypothetical protein
VNKSIDQLKLDTAAPIPEPKPAPLGGGCILPLPGEPEPPLMEFSEEAETSSGFRDSTCEHCDGLFSARTGGGGKPHRFCSAGCRTAFNNEKRESSEQITNQSNKSEQITGQSNKSKQQINEPHQPAPVPVVDNDHDFDWNDTNTVVLREQPETAIYYNPSGDLVIRQRRWPDDDMFVVISEHSLMAFIDRLTDMAGIPSAGRQS